MLAPMFNWVRTHKVVELVGISDDAIRAMIKRGIWLNGVHYTKAPDKRLYFNLAAIEKWITRKG